MLLSDSKKQQQTSQNVSSPSPIKKNITTYLRLIRRRHLLSHVALGARRVSHRGRQARPTAPLGRLRLNTRDPRWESIYLQGRMQRARQRFTTLRRRRSAQQPICAAYPLPPRHRVQSFRRGLQRRVGVVGVVGGGRWCWRKELA